MKKNILFLFLSLSLSNAFAQNIKVYNHFSFSKSFSNVVSQSSISYGEFVNYHKIVDMKFFTSLAYNFNNLKANNLDVYSGTTGNSFEYMPEYIHMNSNVLRSNFSVPIGAEISFKGLGIGVNTELLSLGFKNSIGTSKFDMLPETVTTIYPTGFSTIFSPKDKRSLTTKIYAVYTLNDSFSLLAGINTQKVIYRFLDTDKVTIFTAGKMAAAPFVTLRFNVEK